MRTVRRLFYADITASVAFVSLAFLALFFFIDFVDELRDVGERGYTAAQAAGYALLRAPAHLYELMPITVLIGTIYTLARLAQTSQYTILRTGGLAPARALWLLTSLALVFGLFTYVVGDYVAPFSERLGRLHRSGDLRPQRVRIHRRRGWLLPGEFSGPEQRRNRSRPSAVGTRTKSRSLAPGPSPRGSGSDRARASRRTRRRTRRRARAQRG